MYNVSDDYRNQINRPVRNYQYIKIKIFNTYNIKSDLLFDSNGNALYDANNLRLNATHADDILLEIDTTVPQDNIDFIDSSWENEIEPMGTKLPIENFSFSFFDRLSQYNPEITGGKWETIEQNRPISWWYGYQLDSGIIEWVKGSTYVTTGSNAWDNTGFIPKVTINASSIISYLENGVTAKISGTYYKIADNALRVTSLPIMQNNWFTWIIDDVLKTYKSDFLLERALPLNQMLQLISQAAGCILKTDRDGNITIKQYNDTMLQYWRMGYDKILSIPQVTQYPILLSLSMSYSTVAPGDFVTIRSTANPDSDYFYIEAVNFQNTLSSGWGYRRFYLSEPFINCEVVTAERLDQGTWAKKTNYSLEQINTTQIKISAFAVKESGVYTRWRFTVKGQPFVETSANNTVNYPSSTGDVAEIENAFITSSDDADRMMQYMQYFLQMRNMYSGVNNRGYPEIDSGDIIYAQSNYNFHFPVIVLANNIKFNGSFSGDMKYLAKNIDENTIFGLITDNNISRPVQLLATGGIIEDGAIQILDWRNK